MSFFMTLKDWQQIVLALLAIVLLLALQIGAIQACDSGFFKNTNTTEVTQNQ